MTDTLQPPVPRRRLRTRADGSRGAEGLSGPYTLMDVRNEGSPDEGGGGDDDQGQPSEDDVSDADVAVTVSKCLDVLMHTVHVQQ